MFEINNAAKAKKSARALEKFLEKHGLNLGHGNALNAVAALAGFEDWNGLQAQLKAQPAEATPNIWDVDFSKVQVVNVFSGDYTIDDLDDLDVLEWLHDWNNVENPLRARNPIALRLASQNEDSYGSVVLRAKELLSFKWDAKQQCFVSPEQGRMTLLELTPYRSKLLAKANPIAADAPASATNQVFTVRDIDFSKVTGLSRGAAGFWVDSQYYPEALSWLNDWSNPANHHDADVPVLELTYIDDEGFTAHQQVLADELLSLKWSAAKGLFVSPNGVEYKFKYQVPVGPDVVPKVAPAVSKTLSDEAAAPTRYVVEVYSLESDDETCSGREHVSAWECTAHSPREAEEHALCSVWDEDLEASGAEPSCDVREVGDEENGPFTILVGQGHSYGDATTSFQEAWRLARRVSAQHLHKQNVWVMDSEWNTLYTFNKK